MKIDYTEPMPMGMGDTVAGNVIPMLTASPVPAATTMSMPSLTATANATLDPNTAANQITPQDLNARLPSIVNQTPSVVAPSCGSFSQWVNDNPLLAAGLLAVAAVWVFGGHKK